MFCFKNIFLFFFALMAFVTVAGQPVANFAGSPVSGCAPLTVNYTDQSTGNPTSWSWNLGNGTNSTVRNPVATYFAPGTYTVALTVRNAAGQNTITKNQYITVYDTPSVRAVVSNSNGCAPLVVNFTDNSLANGGTITNWRWDFGDGTISNQQNPQHSYNSQGTFNVSLTITTSNGCTRTRVFPGMVVVTATGNPNFSNTRPSSCTAPISVSFTNLSQAPAGSTYQWFFGDGNSSTQTNPVHNYASAGTYDVTLVVSNGAGCRDTLFRPGAVVIGTVNTDFTAPTVACAGNRIQFTNTTQPTPATSRWTFGDGTSSTNTNPRKTYTTPGTYVVTLETTLNGCTSVRIRTVTVINKPTANITANTYSSCTAPLTVNFQSNSTASSYMWSFGDGSTSTDPNPTHTYTSNGTYSVTLIVSNGAGCNDTISRPGLIRVGGVGINIQGIPGRYCEPYTHTFSAASGSPTDPIVSYIWSLGNGVTSTAANPVQTYSAGEYSISLTATTASGCTETVSYANGLQVGSAVHAAFTANPLEACAERPIDFTDQSTGQVLQWQWDFGDGGSSGDQNPTYQYNDTGYFNVMLVVSNFGCRDTLIRPRYVHIGPPIPSFQLNPNCSTPYNFTFTNNSIGVDSLLWQFGDGDTSTAWSPTHIYQSPGVYAVQLTVHNDSTGCTLTKSDTIIISGLAPSFKASDTIVCKNTNVRFFLQDIPRANVRSVEWDFGDGTARAFGDSVTHRFATADTFDITAFVTLRTGCIDTIKNPQYIKVFGPTADFDIEQIRTCLNVQLIFHDSSATDGVHPIVSYQWDYGDTTGIQTLTGGPFTHTYHSTGPKDVTLWVYDNFGCKDSIKKEDVVNITHPSAGFTTDSASCPGRDVAFLNTSTANNPGYVWFFGDGDTSVFASPSHTYADTGHFNITMVVTDGYGCTDTAHHSLQILKPKAAFTVNDTLGICPPSQFDFTAQAVGYEALLWDFGDGGTSTVPNPSHVYTDAGRYTVKLTAIGFGQTCIDTIVKHIIVRGPKGSFDYQPVSGCYPLQVNFQATGENVVSYTWDFDDGNVQLGNSSITHSYTIPDDYIPKMIMRDSSGCVVAVSGTKTINVFGGTIDFASTDSTLCDKGFISFQPTFTGNDTVTTYLWTFGDGTTSTDVNPTHNFPATGSYTVTLNVQTTHNCPDTTQKDNFIRIVASPQLSILDTLAGCAPFTANFQGSLLVQDTSQIRWLWNLGNGQTSVLQNPVQAYPQAGVYPVTLIAENSSGCRDTATTSVVVDVLPTVDAGSDRSVCQRDSVLLSVTGAASYTWAPATGLTCATCASTYAFPDTSTLYVVTGRSSRGCVAKDSVFVRVFPQFSYTKGLSDSVCLGQQVILTASGNTHITWTAMPGGAVLTGPRVVVTPSVNTTYYVNITDSLGCFPKRDSINVSVYPYPVVDAGQDVTIGIGGTATLNASVSNDVNHVIWTPTSSIIGGTFPSIVVKPQMTTTYTLTAYNDGMCSATDKVTVFVVCDGSNFFIPNTFTPNGDGQNDVFYPRGTGLFTIRNMKIFNRWGETVFERNEFNANDPNAGWNGSYKGKILNPDVYVYTIDILCQNNTTLRLSGNVALVR